MPLDSNALWCGETNGPSVGRAVGAADGKGFLGPHKNATITATSTNPALLHTMCRDLFGNN